MKTRTTSSPFLKKATRARPLFASAICSLVGAVATPSHAEDYYLRSLGSPDVLDAVPYSTLTSSSPFLPVMVNYDPGRDSHPGTLVEKGGSSHTETNAVRQQTWRLMGGNLDLDGPASLTLYAAMGGFDASGKRGHMQVMLVECDPDGTNCALIKDGFIDSTSWSGGWDQFNVNFGNVTHTVPAGRVMGVKAIVLSSSDDHMMLGYGTTGQASRVSVTLLNPPSNDVDLTVVKSSSRSWAYVGTSITYTLQYNCVSTIAAGQNVTITDTLDPFMTVTGITNSSHIASSNYDPGTNTVVFNFVDPLPAGSTGEVQIVAEFIPGVADGYSAPNTALIAASNGADVTSNTVSVEAEVGGGGGPGDPTGGWGYAKGVYFLKTGSDDLELPYERAYFDIKPRQHGRCRRGHRELRDRGHFPGRDEALAFQRGRVLRDEPDRGRLLPGAREFDLANVAGQPVSIPTMTIATSMRRRWDCQLAAT